MRPDSETLIRGVAAFLGGELALSISDRALRFRVTVAAHLLGVALRDLRRGDDEETAAAFARMLEGELNWLGCETDAWAWLNGRRLEPSRADAVRGELEYQLTQTIRRGDLDPDRQAALRSELMALLVNELAVVNPRFDPRLDAETPE